MSKTISLFALAISLIFVLFSSGFAQESLTITTYYPSPYGSYNFLYATSMGLKTTTPGGPAVGNAIPGSNRFQVGDYSTNESIIIASSNNTTGSIYFTDNNRTEGGGISVTGVSNGSVMSFFNRYDTDSTKITFDLVNGRVGIGTTVPGTKLAISGLTATAGTTIVVDGSGNFYTLSSSKRYKDNIKDLKTDYEKILKLKPKSFTYKATGAKDIGYVAEDFEKIGLKDFLVYNNDGKPESIKYDNITTYLVEVVKEQREQINRLSEEINELKQQK